MIFYYFGSINCVWVHAETRVSQKVRWHYLLRGQIGKIVKNIIWKIHYFGA